MKKAILIVLALFAIVSAEQFQRINFNQGKLLLRSLDTASTGKSYALQSYTDNTAVTVNLGTDYLTLAGIEAATQTDMLITLSTNVTAFCTNCDHLVTFKCDDNSCKADQTSKRQSLIPTYYIQDANPFSIPVTIGSDWKLQNNGALLFKSAQVNQEYNNYYTNGANTRTFRLLGNTKTYGWIGLGADGDAAKNFQGDHPLFSLTVSGSGAGQLIFGKDSTQFGKYPTPQIFNATANWTMPLKSISIGADMNTFDSYNLNLVPDLQSPGLGLPKNWAASMFTTRMATTYKLERDDTLNNFTYVYKGELTGLPNIIFGLSNGQNLNIPPNAYTKKNR